MSFGNLIVYEISSYFMQLNKMIVILINILAGNFKKQFVKISLSENQFIILGNRDAQ
jgi:hypothetical protein